MKIKRRELNHIRVLIEDLIREADRARNKSRKMHARTLWRLAMVEKLALERIGLWK